MKLTSLLGMFLFCASTFAQTAPPLLKSPNISANALVLYRQSNFAKEDSSTVRNGLDIQAVDIAFYADVDPYSRLSVLLGIHPEYELNSTTGKVEKSWNVEPEEVFAESIRIPWVTLKAGKFKAHFGKHNILHDHVFPFVDAPMINSVLLGEEGLNDTGASAAGLLPVPWFSELTVQYLRGEGENYEFNSATPSDGVGLGRWKNLFDLTEAVTFEVGASFASGHNAFGGDTSLAGADMTLRGSPLAGGKARSWILATEYMQRRMEQDGAATEKGSGIAAWGQYRFAERWTARARYETLKIENSNATVNPDHVLLNGLTTRSAFAVVFDATEFSQIRVEYGMAHGPRQANGETDEQRVYVQGNFTIGSHPAHVY